MANDVYNNKSSSSLQDAYARLNEAIKQRNALQKQQQYDTTNGVALNTTPVGVNGQQPQKSDANWAWRTIGTIDEALRNVGRGFLKLGEGVVDAHIAIAGIFDKEWAENVIKYDAVNAIMEWEAENASLNALYKQNTGSNLYDESWLNDANEKVQNIVQGVEQGIGNALGFMSWSGIPYGIGTALQWSGSSGMVMEESFNSPDYNGNYYGAWGKGFIMGGVETGLEYLLGWSPKKMGVSAKTFKTVLKELGKDFVEEGFEEVASDLISPLLEGMDSTKGIGEAYKESFENLGETFLVGGLTGALMSGAGEVSSAIYLSPEGQKIAYEINENHEYYKQAYENFKNNPNEQEAYDNFIKVRDEVATNLKALGERVGKLASKYQNRLGTTATINGQKVQLPMTQEVLNEQADITSKSNPVIMAVKETIDLMNNSNIKGIDNMKVEFVTEGSEAYKKAFKTDAKGINGAYDKNTNTFYLNTNSAKAFKFVTGHEITHLMEENGAYEDVYDEILDSLEKSGEYDKLYEKTSKLYEDQIKGMSKEQARKYINQEIVADYFGENFKNFSEIQKLFKKQSTWEKFKDLIKSVRKSNRSSKAKDYYQRFLKEASNTKIEEKEQPTKAVAYSKSNYDVEIELENPNRDSYIKAKKEFGTTYRINLAGWLNVDGSMLDFSDGQGYRVQDHREIQNIYKDNEWTDALIQYLAEGNIRLQSYGFELWRKPTQQQIEVLKRHIKNNYGEVVVDIDYNKNGDTKTFEYERGTPANKIIEDINNYFDNGIEPIIDKADNFKYSKSIDSEGNNLSEQQARFFKDSKVVDENGNLLVVYHGSKNVGFNTFDINKYGESGHPEKAIFFTNSKKFADNFKGKNGETREFYLNIKKPLDLNNLNEKEIEMLANMQDFGLPLEENKKHIKEYIEAKNYYALKMYVDYSKAQKLGYDGVIVSASNLTIEYAVFNSNQIKSIENKNPTLNDDIRFSKVEKIEWSEEESTDGDTLSKQQARFFKNSKIREDGSLMIMYHGTNNGGFMTFDSESGVYFFTPDYEVALTYTEEIDEPEIVNTSKENVTIPKFKSVDEVIEWWYTKGDEYVETSWDIMETSDEDVQEALQEYINLRIKRLKEINAPQIIIDNENIKNYNGYILLNEGKVFEYYPYELTEDPDEFTEDLFEEIADYDDKFKNTFFKEKNPNEAIYQFYLNITNPLIIDCKGSTYGQVLYKGKRMLTDDIAIQVKKEGKYDGIIFKNVIDNGPAGWGRMGETTDVYVAFEQNQIKAVDNYNPTSNPDIRYSKSGTTINQPKQKLVAQLKDGKVYDIVDGQVVIDLFTKQLKTNDEQIIITPNRDKLLEKINLLLNLEKVGTKEFNSKLEDLAKEIVDSAKVSVETSKVDPKTNKKIREYISLNKYLGLTKQEVTDYLIPRFIEEVNRVAVVNGKKSLVTIYKEKSQQKIDALKQTYIDFINDLNTTIKNLGKEIKSIKKLEKNSKTAMLKIANIKYWAKTNFDSKATYKADTIEAKFAQSAQVIAKLKFNPNTAQLDKSYGAVIQKLYEFYFDNDANALVNSLKLEDATAKAYIDEALNYFNARYTDTSLQTSPLETNKLIDDANYPMISGKTETQVYADILGEMRRIINKANNLVYGELGGQRVLVKDAVKPEIAFQESINRKVANNLFTNSASNYVLSLIDTKAYMTIMAHGDSNSLIMKIYQQLFEGQKETYRIEQDLLSGLNTFLQDKNNKKLVKKLKQSKHNIKFCNVEMTLGEAIGLYMMMGTDNAPSHLGGDGVTFETKVLKQVRKITGKDFYAFASQKINSEIAMINSIKKVSIKKGQNYTKKQLAYLKKKFNATNKTNADLDGRLAELNKETLKIAREELKKLIGNDYDGLISTLEELYSKSGNYYTEASRKMFGFSFVPKTYYYPTRSSKEELKDIDALTSYVSNSLNPSFTKKAVGGTNELFVGDVIDTALSFTSTLSKYCGVTVEIKNVRKFLNAEVDGKSINKILKENVDLKFTEKMNDLFKEMQGIKVAPKSFIEKAIKKFRSFASKSALGLNLKTAITQYTSYPKAFMFLKGENLFVKALKGKKARTKDGLVDFDYAMNNSAYISNRYKNGNVYNIEAVGAIEKIDTFTDLTMKPLEFTDKQVLKRIWYACQYECMDANGKVDLNKAIPLFEQVVSDTQAQYDALGNGSITRTNSEFMKGSLMYSAENRKTLSRLVEAFYLFAISKNNPAQHKKASNYLAKVSVCFLAQSAMVIGISTLLKYLKGDYDDEEAEEIVLGIVKDELAMNIIGMFPVIKDFYSYLVQGYDYKVSGISQMYEFLSVLNDIPAMLDIEANDGERRKAFFQAVTKISHFFGVPVKNVFNDILYPLGIVDKTLNTSMVMKMKNFYYNTTNANLNTYLKNYSKKGKEKQVSATIQMKFKNYISGDIDDVSADELARLYMNGSLETFPTQLSNSVYVDGVEYTLNKAQKSHAQAIYDIANDLLLDLIKSYSYSVLTDDEKVKAIKKLYDTYYELIKGSVVSDYKGTKLSQVANYVDMVKYSSILSKISGLKETNNQTRKGVVQNYINKQKMSSNEKYLLYYLAGYSLDDEKKKLVQNYLKTKGMNYTQAKEFVQPAQK